MIEILDTAALHKQLIEHEGLRLKPYRDTVGKLTIGVGRNLDDVGIDEHEAAFLLHADIDRLTKQFEARLPWLDGLDEKRLMVIYDMGFNLGIGGLLKFRKMLAALKAHDYDNAADEMLDSRWARQVGRRAQTLAAMMRPA